MGKAESISSVNRIHLHLLLTSFNRIHLPVQRFEFDAHHKHQTYLPRNQHISYMQQGQLGKNPFGYIYLQNTNLFWIVDRILIVFKWTVLVL